jgi:arabinose-5-phosphate isomerase
MTNYLDIAKKTIAKEIEGLTAMQSSLDNNFNQLVDKIVASKGRVIISGMGKSGYIAKKISATLASTGTPAFFVHPAEASHGDLGMIDRNDIVILLSNSGETKELADIIYYCKRFSITLVGVVRRKTSTLVEASDIIFVLPDTDEASSVAAPTTSTTMMLVWGDCLAVALETAKGFTKNDFNVYHPGGKLGQQFIKVSKIMKTGDDIPVAQKDAKMSEVILEISRKNLGTTAVLDGDKLVGIITDGDLRRHLSDNIASQLAQDVMKASPLTISEDLLAIEALAIMQEKKISCLLTTDRSGKLAGIITLQHLLSAGV